MDPLVSVGALAAFAWSLYALFFGTAGMPGMRHPFALTIEAGSGAGNIYLEVAAGVTVFILAGRYFEARSKRRAGSALRALLEIGAKDVAVLRGAGEVRIPIDQMVAGDVFVVRPGEKIATDGGVTGGASGGGGPGLPRRPGPRGGGVRGAGVGGAGDAGGRPGGRGGPGGR